MQYEDMKGSVIRHSFRRARF